jgi:hypothetical protein
MSSTPRRAGFRLPWSSTSGEPEPMSDADQAPEAAADEAGAEVRGSEPEAEQVSRSAAASQATPAAAMPRPAGTQAETEPPAEFLNSLLSAMRGVADEARDTSLEQLRNDLAERVRELHERTARRAEELHHASDADLAAVGTWEEAEIERVRAEASRRAEARKQQLDQQVADSAHRTETAIEMLTARVNEYERELDAFFASLANIADPYTFVAATKRMPRSPVLAAHVAATSQAAVAPAASTTVTPQAPAVEVEAEKPATQTTSAAPAPATPDADIERDALSQRLSALDAMAAQAAAAATQGAPESNGSAADVATAVVVKGLGSFGAITTFKQSIERLTGVHSVALSLGPTGEFVYRAVHDSTYDLTDALRKLEPGADVERQPDGTLRLTIQRSR